MNKKTHKELVELIQDDLDYTVSKANIDKILKSLSKVVKNTVESGDAVSITKLGKFYPKMVKARNYRKIKTGQMYTKPAHRIAKCTVSKSFNLK